MRNYLIKYSNYFMLIGLFLLILYAMDIVPYRFRNIPDTLRWLAPVIFMIIGIIGKLIANENSINSKSIENFDKDINSHSRPASEMNFSNGPDFFTDNDVIKSGLNNLTPNEWLKQNPGKTLNDYFIWRKRN